MRDDSKPNWAVRIPPPPAPVGRGVSRAAQSLGMPPTSDAGRGWVDPRLKTGRRSRPMIRLSPLPTLPSHKDRARLPRRPSHSELVR